MERLFSYSYGWVVVVVFHPMTTFGIRGGVGMEMGMGMAGDLDGDRRG